MRHSINFVTFNSAGIIMATGSFVTGLILYKLSGATNPAAVMFSMGAPALLFDLLFRLCRTNGHWIVPECGGMAMEIPIWIWGCLCLAAGVWCAVYEPAVAK